MFFVTPRLYTDVPIIKGALSKDPIPIVQVVFIERQTEDVIYQGLRHLSVHGLSFGAPGWILLHPAGFNDSVGTPYRCHPAPDDSVCIPLS